MQRALSINGIFLLIAVVLFFTNPFATRAAKYNAEAFVSAATVYTSYRVINRVLSVAADTSVQVGIVGASASFKPGQILRSLLDTLDRFADILFPLMILSGVLSVAISPVASLAAALAALGFLLRMVADPTGRYSAALAAHINRLGTACAGVGTVFALLIPLTYSAGYLIGNQITADRWERAVRAFAAFEADVHVADTALQDPSLVSLSGVEGSGEHTASDEDRTPPTGNPGEAESEGENGWRLFNWAGQSWTAVEETWSSLGDGVSNVVLGARSVASNSVQIVRSVPDYLDKSSELVSAAFQYLIALIVKTLVIPTLLVGVGLWLWRVFWIPANTQTRPTPEIRDRSPSLID